jgi:hypothetical protein
MEKSIFGQALRSNVRWVQTQDDGVPFLVFCPPEWELPMLQRMVLKIVPQIAQIFAE